MTRTPFRVSIGVVAVVTLYALFASVWILLSDRAIGLLFRDPEALVQASMLKGWLFVAVTTLLLWGLVRRLTGALEEAHRRELALLRERERPPPMLEAIAQASSDGIFAKDLDGRYVLFNAAAAHAIGRQPDDVIGRDAQALFPPSMADRLDAQDRQVLASGQAETTEETLHTPDGERVFQSTKGPLRAADGTVFGTYGISRDITERKREEQALRRLADDLGATLAAIPDLMFEFDDQGRYLKAKAFNEALLAVPKAELLGRTAAEVLPAEAAATVMQALAAAGRDGTDFGRTISLPLETGLRHFELSVARKPTQAGEGVRFIVLSRDITARHQAEAELRQRNHELERFNRAATERELRMVALKREVNALARAAGRPEPYDLAFADTSAVPATP